MARFRYTVVYVGGFCSGLGVVYMDSLLNKFVVVTSLALAVWVALRD